MKRAWLKSLAASAALAGGMMVTMTAQAETADELFERGRTLAAAQRYAEACPLLAESVKTEPGIGARLWLGECYEKTGRLASALAEFKAAEAEAGARKDDREKVAARRASVLEPRVPRILVAAAEGVTLTVDGKPAAAGIADPFDAGLHTITAVAPGFVKWSVSVSVPDAPGVVSVNVPALEKEKEAEAPRTPPALIMAPGASPTQVVVHSEGLGPMRIAAIATGAVGLAALGGGAFLGLQAKSTYDSSNQAGHCVANACDAQGKDARASASSMAAMSTIAFFGAGTALASSIVLLILAPSTTVAPAIGPHEAGLAVGRRF